MNYKAVICGSGFLQELELSERDSKHSIGTDKGCIVRFDSRRIGENFLLDMQHENNTWRFIAVSGVVFVLNKEKSNDIAMTPGDKLYVHSSVSDKELFTIDFFVDYGLKNADYDLRINLALDNEIKIGREKSNISIADDALGGDYLMLYKQNDGYVMDASLVKNKVTMNGSPVRSDKEAVKNGSFFSIVGYQFYLYNNELFTTSDGTISTILPNSIVTYQQNHFKYPQYIKNARQQYIIPEGEIEVLDPKQAKEPNDQNVVVTLIPTLMSTGIMMLVRSVGGSGKRMMAMCIGMMVAGVATSIFSFVNQKKKAKKDEIKRENNYLEYIKGREEYIISMREKEFELSCQKSPSLEEDIQFVADFDSRLFSRKKEHDDFLLIRMGTGVVATNNPVKFNTHDYVDTEDFLMDYPKSIKDKYEYIQGMPVLLDLKNCNAIGFVGSRTKLYQMVKNITLTIAIEHFYQDVQIVFSVNEDETRVFDWARWFHNASAPNGVIRNFMYDDDSSKIMLEYLYAELSRRDEMEEKNIATLPHFIVMAYRSEKLTAHPLNKYYSKAAKLGFTFIFFEEYEELVNDSCTKLVFLEDDSNEGVIRDVSNGEITQRFEYEHIPGDIAARAALKLGCVYVDEASLAGSLTKNISLFELLKINNINDLELENRWNSSRIYESMAAPLGVKTGNEIVYLDLHEKYHGPHGLVAGTTGSGKSEILQSYICSMATLFHPYEVGFIIIDFKGGGMVNQFRDLPHLNGAITNIDGREIDRSLLSIKAELLKRQELFAKYNVNKIDDYIKLFKAGETKIALPHLILIVDEFAELKSDQPEFMKELISAARIGRSLGVHLILATQKPSGVVNDQIWSNSKFKLCLKVQTKEDSNEVLKSPLAAEIREPGRAYLQVGNNEIFQLFQSAYSGAPSQFDTLGNTNRFKLSKVSLCGRREVFFEQKPKSLDASVTQLDALVEYVNEYCKRKGIEKLPNICLPPLPEKIPVPAEAPVIEGKDIYIPVGFYDDPSRQLQKEYGINLSQGNVFVLGSSQYGKTTLFQTIIRQIAANYTPAEVCIYIFDFASMFLKNFSTLKHVGGVITAFDDEKLSNCIKMIEESMILRRETFAKLGVTSFSSYREAGFKEFPQIVLMIDNLTSFRELYNKLDDRLLTICRDGVSLGITVIVSNSISSGVGYRYLSNFSTRLAFTCNNSSDYSTLFDRCRTSPREVPGRALVEMDKNFYECQMYIPFDSEKEFEKIELMRAFIKEMNEKYAAYTNVGLIPEVPDVVTKDYIMSVDSRKYGKFDLPVGIKYSDVGPFRLSLGETQKLAISGKADFGKTAFVLYFTKFLASLSETDDCNLFVVDKVNRELEGILKDKKNVKYSCNAEDVKTYFGEITTILQERYEKLMAGDNEALTESAKIVILMNSKEAYDAIDNDRKLAAEYTDMTTKYRNLNLLIVISDMENANISFGISQVFKSFRDNRVLMVFENAGEQKVIEMPLQYVKENSKKLLFGDAFVADNNGLFKVKTVMDK